MVSTSNKKVLDKSWVKKFGRYPAQLAIGAFLFMYFTASSTLLMPYAPSIVAIWLIRYILFFALVAAFCYLGFVHKWETAKKRTSWQIYSKGTRTKFERTKLFIKFLLAPPLFFYGFLFCYQRILAVPTKYFASESVVIHASCIEKSTWGNHSRGVDMIKISETGSDIIYEFPWARRRGPMCPGVITIKGKRGVFGIYVTDVR